MANIMKMGQAPGYLGSWDLDDQPNREITLTIDKIVDEKLNANGQSEVCTVCHWAEKDVPPMVWNVTNKKTVAKLYKTTDTEKLKGKRVTICVARVKAFGDVWDALRIRSVIPAAPSSVLPKCEVCGRDITAAGNMTPEQVAAYRKKRYSRALCDTCAKALAESKAGAAE